MKHVDSWNHILLEGFCCRTFSCEKQKYYKTLEGKKVLNKNYNPNYKTPRKPKHCKDRIGQNCYFNDCPFLGIGEPPKDDYHKIMKKIGEIYDES